MKTQGQQGFALIALIITLAIIGILAAAYYGKSGSGQKSTIETGNKAIEQTKQNNRVLQQQSLEQQNALNEGE